MTARRPVPPVEAPSPELEDLLSRAWSRDGRPLNVFRVLAHHPVLLRRVMGLGSSLAPGSLPERDRELAVLRTAAAVRSEYELAQHAAIGREAGLTDAEIDAAADPGAAHDWSAPDAAVLRFVDQLLEEGAVDDERWEALAAYSVAQRIELVFLVGFYRMLGGFLRSAGVELEPGVSRPRS